MPRIEVLADGYPLSTDAGTLAYCSILLIEGGRRLIFDSGHVGRRALLLSRLAQRGLSPADIDFVLLSHAHWDHVQNCDLFENATVLLHPHERLYARRPHRNDWATPRWTGTVLETLRLQEVGEGYEVMPGCRVLELPGHSAGSIGLEVETEAGRCWVVADALPNGQAAITGRISWIFWSRELAAKSVRRCQQSGALLYPGHDRPFRLKGGEVLYAAEARPLTVHGVGPGTPPVRFEEDPLTPPPHVMAGIEEQTLQRLMDA